MEQLPFIIPFQLRVQAFRKFIESERESEGLNRDDSPTWTGIRGSQSRRFTHSTRYNQGKHNER